MKKIITGILATLSCLALLSGCSFLPGFNNSSTPTESSSSTTTTTGVTLAQAKSFIRELYKDQNVTTSEDYTLITKYAPNANDVFTITWTVDVPETSIKIVPVEGKDQVTVDLDNEANEDVSYTLKGVIANKDGEELEVEFYRTLKAVAQKVPHIITEAPKADVAYKYYIFNPNGKDHQDSYMDGTAPQYAWYLGTSENFEDGLDFYAEYVEGTDTFHLKTTIKGATKYLNIVEDDGHISNFYQDEKGPNPFKFDTEMGTIIATVDGKPYYMGLKGTFNTVQALTGKGNDTYVGYLCELIDRNDLPDAEKVDTEVKALLSLQEAYVGTYELELPATGSSFSTVAIKWTVKGEGAKIENGKLKLTAGTAITEFTLKAEIKLNEAVKPVEMKAKLVPNTETAILEAGAALSKSGSFGNEVELTGVITRDADVWTSDSGSNSNATFRIAVGGRTLGAYRINGSQAVLFEDLVAGAKVTIKGFLAKYNGTLQFAQGSVATKIEKGGVYTEPYTTAEQIFNAATALADGETLDSYTLEGVVSNIASPYDAENGNMNLTIKVGDLAFYCYRLTGSACSIVKVGDTITVTGNIMKYYDNVQFGSGCKITAHKPGEVKPEEPVEGVLASIDMMGTTNLTSRTDDKTVYTANGITYTNDKATSTNPNYNQTGTYAARAYQGSTITITYGTAFKAVVFTLDDFVSNNKQYIFGFDNMTIEGATVVRENDIVLINFETAVTTFTTANLASQVRIEKIELYAENVTEVPGEGETPDTPVVPDTPTTEGPTAITSKPVENTAYKFYMYSTAKNTGFYFTGAMSGYYGATSEKAEEGVDLYVEYAEGSDANFYIYFNKDSVKQYINVVSTGSHVNFTFGTTASTLFTWNETISSFVTVSEFEKDGEKSLYYLGTYNDFTTIGTCKISYTDNYVVKFVTMGEGSTETPDTPVVPDTPTTEGPIAITSKPVENTAYKFYMVNTNKNVGLYFTGAMSGYYGATSEKAEEGVDLYVEYATGSDANFYIYFTDANNAKQYITISVNGTHVNFGFGATATTLFTWNETIGSFVTVDQYNESIYFLGTYDNFTTIGTCKITYTDNYVVKFVTMGEGSTETPDTPVVPEQPETPDTPATPVAGIPANLVFTGLVNNASADTYMKEHYADWTITGKLGNGYADYLGFGRSGDKSSAITSTPISTEKGFTLKVVLKGNAGNDGVVTSKLVFTLVDKDGNVVATGYANETSDIVPPHGKDTTYTITFQFVEGKSWADVASLKINFTKDKANIGMKSLEFIVNE